MPPPTRTHTHDGQLGTRADDAGQPRSGWDKRLLPAEPQVSHQDGVDRIAGALLAATSRRRGAAAKQNPSDWIPACPLPSTISARLDAFQGLREVETEASIDRATRGNHLPGARG